jgi:Putative lumazine-binding
MTDFDAIRDLVTLYFDGLYEGDAEKLSRIFHKRSRLHAMLDGKLSEIEFAPYMDIIKGRASPESIKAERKDQLMSIQQTTSDTAWVIVSLLLSGKSYTDHLSLIKDGGRWQIISKVYHLNNLQGRSLRDQSDRMN